MNARVLVDVTPEFLLQHLFPFPSGTRLVGASVTAEGFLQLALSHPELDEVPFGAIPPNGSPTFERVRFVDWGIKK